MPRIDGKELLLLKGAGGESFARFVDGLIRAEAHLGGLAQSEIDTQVRVNIPDGGVDTRVRGAVPADRSGYLSEPTCWQYKSETYKELIDKGTKAHPLQFLTGELNKAEVKRLVKQGYAFRFCLIGDMTPENVERWEGHLLAECQKVNAAAAKPRVIAADKLAAWAERIPATASLISPPGSDATARLFNFEAWRTNVRGVTREYVPVPGWADISNVILAHVGAARAVNPCLPIQGEAGVGKTRLVFETLARLAESESLVLYTLDDQVALRLSHQLATDAGSPGAVVVADECLLQTRMMIEQNLAGCRDRVRYICISNTGERGATGAPEIWLDEMPRNVVEEILGRNFPLVPTDRRQSYAELAGGFIRFAAALCEDDDRFASGDLAPALGRVEDYIKFRIRDPEEERVLWSLALFTTVGAKGDMAPQLASLCAITAMAPVRVVELAGRLRDSPGFISVAGRFLYVTPAIVARTAFVRGWDKWVRDDPKAFIEKLHPSLVPAFLDRVRIVATGEVKAAVAATFQEWIVSRQAEDLTDRKQVERLTKLVETDADRYLPLLRNLIAVAPSQTLRFADAYGRSPRRELVWLCERLAAFPAYYADCESILFRLAVEESEPNIGNNASGIWCQLQRIFLSGSSAPFDQRFAILHQRAKESAGSAVELCMNGVESIFASHASRMGGPVTVGGRLRPEDWMPRTHQEHRACWTSTLGLLRELATGDDNAKVAKAVDVTIKNLINILENEFLDEARSILSDRTMTPERIPPVIEAIERYLYWCEHQDRNTISATEDEHRARYTAAVRSWLAEITPTSFGGRIRALLSRNQWDESLVDAKGQPNPVLMDLASEALRNIALLEAELPFLASGLATGAPLFGEALGGLDIQQGVMHAIFTAVKPGSDISLARGYVFGLLRRRGSASPELEQWLARVAKVAPRAAFELRTAGGDKLDAFQFAIGAVDAGQLPAGILSHFAFGRRLSLGNIREALRRLVAAATDRAPGARLAAVRFLWALRHGEDRSADGPALLDARVRELAWQALEQLPDDESGTEAHERAELLGQLAHFDPSRAARLLLASSVARRYGSIHDQSLRVLTSLAPAHPNEVMECLGKTLADSDNGVALALGGGTVSVIRALPAAVVVSWVRNAGIGAARAIARQLPLPFVDNNGVSVVPEVTLAVLNEFGADAQTCEGFVTGSFRGDSWWGNGSEHFTKKAATARRFLAHENACVRRWAEREATRSEALAREEQLRYEERML